MKRLRPAAAEHSNSNWKVGVVSVVAIAASAYLAIAMPGMNHSASSTTEMTGMSGMGSSSAAVGEANPEQFATLAAAPTSFVINVHVPYAGQIDGTDAFIAFDEIGQSVDLPADHYRQILVYCRTGRMSKIAADALVAMGYSNVTELTGGMDAWKQSGRSVAVVR